MSLKSLLNQTIPNKSLINGIAGGTGGGIRPPVITSIIVCDSSYNNLDDTALDSAGSYVKLIGTDFKSGCTVYFNNATVTTTFVSSTEVRIETPATSVGAYNIMLFNPTNQGGAIYLNLSVSNAPTYTTSSGSLGTYYEANTISNAIIATGDTPLTYSLYSGSLPSGATLNSNGTITGTSPAESGSTTYSFVVNVKDAQGQDATRSFSLTINTDPVTWSAPTSNQVITAYEYTAISNVTMSASTAAGKSITYTANTLPGGITIDGNTISGTNNTVGNTYTRLTATAATTGRTATQDVVFNIAQDVVTWSSPAEATAYSLSGGSAMANVTLSATSAAGKNITYTANALPSGVSLSGSTIYGTPDTAQTVNTLLTATAATTNRTATRNISWTISLGDTYWKYTTMLLSANTATTSFINDVSLNNSQLTIAGDTKPNNFNPYTEGYYSNYFDGSGDYLSLTNSTLLNPGTGSFTLECWAFFNSVVNNASLYRGHNSGLELFVDSTGHIAVGYANISTLLADPATLSTGTWYHFAIVRSGTNLSLYKNGTRVATSSSSTTNFVADSITTIGINGPVGGYPHNGYISNLRLVIGSAIYDPTVSTLTVPTGPLTAVANTKLLTCQSNRLIDNSLNNFAITKNGDTTVSPAIPFATPTTAAYNTQYSTYFDGTGDWLTAPDNAALELGSSDFTIEGWFYQTGNLSTSSGGTGLVTKWTDAGNQRGWQFSVRNAAGTMTFYYSTTGSNFPVVTFNSVGLTLNTWTHLALVRTGNTLNLYKDGSLAGTSAFSSTIYDNTSPLAIGAWFGGTAGVPDTAAGNSLFQGYVSNVRVVKGVAVYTGAFTPPTNSLTATQSSGTNISAITSGQTSLLTCQNSTLIDNSTNALAITSNGDARPIAVSPFTMTTANTTVTSLGSAYFDGTGDYLIVPGDQRPTGDFTVESWIYPTIAFSQTLTTLFTFGNEASGRYNFGLNSTGVPATDIYAGSGPQAYGSTAVKPNVWTHLAWVRSGTTVTAYINGVASGTVTFSGTLGNATNMYIGAVSSAAALFTGYVSDFKYTKQALYTANFLPTQIPLTAVSNTQLLTCQTNGGGNNNGFVDQSSFNNIVARTGNVTQGTFSPYSATGWSYYFDGTGDYLSAPSSSQFAFGTGDFTIECWVYITADSSATRGIWQNGVSDSCNLQRNTSGNLQAWDGSDRISTTAVPSNTWNHVAFSRASGTARIFVNGVQALSWTSTVNYSSASTWIVGYTASGTNMMTGQISNFRILKGTALYTSAFTPSTTPLTAVANTQLLTCQSNRIVDNSPNNSAITKNGDVSVQAYSPFGGVTSVPTSYSNYFDGTGDYIVSPSSQSAANLTGDFTIEFWFYRTVNVDVIGLFGIGSTDPDSNLIRINAGVLQFWLGGSNSGASGTGTKTGQVNCSTTLAYNTWYHVALVRSGSSTNNVKLYLNGVLDGQGTGTYQVPANYICIGRSYPSFNGEYFNGHISNLRVTKGQALYTGTFTPSTTPLTTTSQGATASNVVLLTCQSPTIIDNSSSGITLTGNGDAKPRTFNPFGMTNTTSVSYTPSVNGGSMYFDGTGDYLLVPDNGTILDVQSSDFTIECWFYPTVTPNNNLFAKRPNTSTFGGISVYFSNSLTPTVLTTVNGSSWGISSASSVSCVLNAWNHIALTRSGSTWKLFVNGIQGVSATLAGTVPDNSSALSIAAAAADGTSPLTAGYITDFRFLNGTALYTSNFYPGAAPATPTQTIGTTTYSSNLLLNGTSGGIVDAHGTNILETVGNTQLAPQDPYGGSYYSNYFDGSGDYLSTTNTTAFNLGTGDFTIEAWVYPTTFTPGGGGASDGCTVIGAYPSTGTITGYSLALSSTGYILFNTWVSGSQQTLTSTSNQLTSNKWNHIAITKTSSTFKIFVNGVVATFTGTMTQAINTGGTVKIGALLFDTYYNYFTGYISNLRVIKGTSLYTSAFTPSTTPLTAVANTSLLICQSNKFVDNSTNNFTITRNGDTKVQSQNPFQQNTGKSLYFDGSGDYLKIPNPGQTTVFNGDFTIEGWVYYDATSITNYAGIVGGDSGSFVPVYALSNNKLECGIWGSSAIVTSSGTIATRQWVYIALVRSSGVVRWYINGTQDSATASNSSVLTVANPTIGSSPTASWNGYIKDLRITKGVARYTTTFTPPTTPLSVK